MLHVLFLTTSPRWRDVVAQLLPPSVCLAVASPRAGPRSVSGPDVGLFDLELGLPVLRRWTGRDAYRLPVVALARAEEEKLQAPEKGVTDVLVWKDLSSPRLLHALRKATRSVAPQEPESRLYESLFRQSRLIQWLVEPGSGRILDANRAAARFYEYEPNRLAQLRIADINELPPRDIAEKMQQAVYEEQNRFTFCHRTATGKKKNVQLWSYPVHTTRGPLLFSTIHPINSEGAAQEEALGALSPRELEIFHLLAEGKTIAQIKEALFLAHGTVKNHLSRIYRKLGVSGRAEALYWAAKRDLVR